MSEGNFRAVPGVWSIMRPVQGQIRLAMTLAGLAAACALGALCALAWGVHALLTAPASGLGQPCRWRSC